MTTATPDTQGGGYLLYHSIGQYPGKAEAMAGALEEFARRWSAADDGQWGYALGVEGRFLELWRRLIGAPDGSLAACENVTAGLYSLIGALPAEHLRGRRVLIAADGFPSLHFLLAGLQERLGFRLDTVPLRPGARWVEDEDVVERWQPDVGVALLTTVTSTASYRLGLEALVGHGRRMGSLIGVDVTQGVGLIPCDVSRPPVDFLVSTSLKWLCGAPGAGVLYVAPSLLPACRPEFRGWFSQENPFSWDLDAFAFAPDARRFGNGTPALVANAASVPALEWRLAQHDDALLGHNRALTGMLMAGLEALGATLASPRDDAQRGGSVMCEVADDAAARRLLSELRAEGLFADARGRVLRFSPGVVTTEAGVTRMLAVLERVLRKG